MTKIQITPGTLNVQQGDVLITSKPLVETNKDSTLHQRSPIGWIDRMTGKPFAMPGVTMLKPLGPTTGGYVKDGYTYQVVDGPQPEVPPVTAPVTPPPPVTASTLYGINLSGGEFNGADNGSLLPTPDHMQAYYDVGYRAFRIPVKMSQFDTCAAKLAALANKAIALGTPCVFENHSYAWPSVADQIAQVAKADSVLPKHDIIQYGTQNEPNLKDFDQWARDTQAIVNGVRAAGITRFLWIDYPGSSGAQRFDKVKRGMPSCDSAACAMAKMPGGTIKDPLGKTGIDIHRYFDKNGSGTSMDCDVWVNILGATTSSVNFGLPIMLGEYAFRSDSHIKDSCAALAPAIMREIKQSPNLRYVMLWGGGMHWGNYMFRALPNAGSDYVKLTTGH